MRSADAYWTVCVRTRWNVVRVCQRWFHYSTDTAPITAVWLLWTNSARWTAVSTRPEMFQQLVEHTARYRTSLRIPNILQKTLPNTAFGSKQATRLTAPCCRSYSFVRLNQFVLVHKQTTWIKRYNSSSSSITLVHRIPFHSPLSRQQGKGVKYHQCCFAENCIVNNGVGQLFLITL